MRFACPSSRAHPLRGSLAGGGDERDAFGTAIISPTWLPHPAPLLADPTPPGPSLPPMQVQGSELVTIDLGKLASLLEIVVRLSTC
jgi:hypothetical protein